MKHFTQGLLYAILTFILILLTVYYLIKNERKTSENNRSPNVPDSFTVKGFKGPDTSDTGYSYKDGKYYKSYSTIAGFMEDEIAETVYIKAYNDAKAQNKLI